MSFRDSSSLIVSVGFVLIEHARHATTMQTIENVMKVMISPVESLFWFEILPEFSLFSSVWAGVLTGGDLHGLGVLGGSVGSFDFVGRVAEGVLAAGVGSSVGVSVFDSGSGVGVFGSGVGVSVFGSIVEELDSGVEELGSGVGVGSIVEELSSEEGFWTVGSGVSILVTWDEELFVTSSDESEETIVGSGVCEGITAEEDVSVGAGSGVGSKLSFLTGIPAISVPRNTEGTVICLSKVQPLKMSFENPKGEILPLYLTQFNDMHPLNALDDIVETDFGRIIFVNNIQLENASVPIEINESGSVISVSDAHSLNDFSPIFVILPLIWILDSFLQWWKRELLIIVIFEGKIILSNDVQYMKAASSISMIDSGIITSFRFVQLIKVRLPIDDIGSLIVIFVSLSKLTIFSLNSRRVTAPLPVIVNRVPFWVKSNEFDREIKNNEKNIWNGSIP